MYTFALGFLVHLPGGDKDRCALEDRSNHFNLVLTLVLLIHGFAPQKDGIGLATIRHIFDLGHKEI